MGPFGGVLPGAVTKPWALSRTVHRAQLTAFAFGAPLLTTWLPDKAPLCGQEQEKGEFFPSLARVGLLRDLRTRIRIRIHRVFSQPISINSPLIQLLFLELPVYAKRFVTLDLQRCTRSVSCPQGTLSQTQEAKNTESDRHSGTHSQH